MLITGGNSQIGHCLLSQLADTGQRVTAAVRTIPIGYQESALIDFVKWDLAEGYPEFTVDAEYMVHIAGIWLLPSHLTTLHEFGIRRLVCFSSTSIPVKQNSPNAVEREQARRAHSAEIEIARQCDALGIEWTILRPTLVYGLGMDKNISRAARFIQKFRFYPVAVDANGRRQPVHADDLAAVALKALRTPKAAGQRYDVGGGEVLAYQEMIGRIFDVLGIRRRFVPLPFLEHLTSVAGVVFRRPEVTGEMVKRMRRDLLCDNRSAMDDLAYAPRPFLSGGLSDLGDIGLDRH